MYLLFSLALMTSLGWRWGAEGPGEAGHFTPPGLPPPHLGHSHHATRTLSQPLGFWWVGGRLSPVVLPPPGLVGVKETLTEEEGVQGHHLLQLWARALLQR